MKYWYLLLLFLFVCCSGNRKFPEEFVGHWEFDVESARAGIQKMNISSSQKGAFESTFINLARGNKVSVNSDGIFRHDGVPNEVYIILEVLAERDSGYIMSSKNVLNQDEVQYTLDSVQDGVWRSIILDEHYKPISEFPDNYWKQQ